MRRLLILLGVAAALLLAGVATALGRDHRARPAHHAGVVRHHARHRAGSHHKRHRHHARRRHHRRKRHRHHRPKAHPAPTGTTTTTPTPAAPTPPAPTAAGTPAPDPCPSGPPGSVQSIGGHNYTLEGMDTFTKNAPLGSFAQSAANQIVYTGDHGMNWTGYPDGWSSTYSGSAEGYQPSTVLSVHDGVLDFHLHNDAQGHPVGADPSPLPGGNRYQTYGAWSFCERVAPADAHRLADFKQAPLLWPQNDSDGARAESDFPEGDYNGSEIFSGFSHYGGSGSQDVFEIRKVDPSYDPTQWHVYTQTWGPGFKSYFIDGRLVGTATDQIWSGPERWQLQIEPVGTVNDGDTGDIYFKWIWIGTFTS